jgi:hypothetical protein
MHGDEFTHPDDTAFVDPLFAARKEGEKDISVIAGSFEVRPAMY